MKGFSRKLRKPVYQVLVNHFSLDELRTVAFLLGIDYEDLPGRTKGSMARELLLACERTGLLSSLINAIEKERPAVLPFNLWPQAERPSSPAIPLFLLAILGDPADEELLRTLMMGEGLDEPHITGVMANWAKDERVIIHQEFGAFSYRLDNEARTQAIGQLNHFDLWRLRVHQRVAYLFYERAIDADVAGPHYQRAIHHYLEGKAYDKAIQVMIDHTTDLVEAGIVNAVLPEMEKLEKQLSVSEEPFSPQQSLWLYILRGDLYFHSGELEYARAPIWQGLNEIDRLPADVYSFERARLLSRMGTICDRSEQSTEAIKLLDESLTLINTCLREPATKVDGYRYAYEWMRIMDSLGTAYQSLALTQSGATRDDSLDKALTTFEALRIAALAKGKWSKPKRFQARALVRKGQVFTDQNNWKAASESVEQGLSLYQEMDHQSGIWLATNELGRIYLMQGQYDLARNAYMQSLKAAELINNKEGVGMAHLMLGEIAIILEDYIVAQRYLDLAQPIIRQLQDKTLEDYEAACRLWLQGMTHARRGNIQDAAALLSEVLRRFQIIEYMTEIELVQKALHQLP